MKTVYVLSLMLLFPLLAIAGPKDFLHEGNFYKDAKVMSVEGDKATIQVAGPTPGSLKTAVVPVNALPVAVKAEGAAMIEAAKQRAAAMANAKTAVAGGAEPSQARLTGKIIDVKGMTLIVRCEIPKDLAFTSASSLNKDNSAVVKASGDTPRPKPIAGVFVVVGHPNALTKERGTMIDVDAVKLGAPATIDNQPYTAYKIMRVVK